MALFGVATYDSYQYEQQRTKQRARQTARILYEHTLKVFETQDLVIRQLEQRIRGLDWPTIAHSRRLHEDMKRMVAGLPQIDTLWLSDANGDTLNSSRYFPITGINVADRDYFVAQREQDVGLFVSHAYQGRLTNRPQFNVSRRISAPDGAFDGVISVSMSPSYFAEFYASFDRGRNDVIAVVRADGDILARYPLNAAWPHRLRHASPFAGHTARAAEGEYVARSEVDGLTRFYHYKKLGAYPVYVVYGANLAAATNAWETTLWRYAAFAVPAFMLLLAFGALTVRRTMKLAEANERLGAEIKERETAQAALVQSQKMEAIGQLTGGVAHDFNNLLTAVLGNLGLALARADNPVMKRLLIAAADAAERGAKVTSQLLAFARKQDVRPETTDLNGIIGRTYDLLARSAGPTVEIDRHFADHLWLVMVDRQQIELALVNLVVNARDAMPSGGKLTIHTENIPARRLPKFTDLAPGDYVLVEVADTGTGMSPDTLERAFEPFFTTKEIGKGSGLGLPMVLGTAQQAGGTVEIESRVDHGTTVRLYLPRTSGYVPTRATQAAEHVAIPSSPKARVLVVDDDDDVRQIILASLVALGHSAVEAKDADAALRVLDGGESIDLAVVDFAMPRMNGGEFAAVARARHTAMPILFVTGYVDLDRAATWLAGETVLRKPFKVADIAKAITEALGART